jgi:hypothetical protein
MPASLFARWAGAKPSEEYRVTPATAVTRSEKPSDPAAFAGLTQVADKPEKPVTTATTSPRDAFAVTAVAEPLEPWLPQKPEQKQYGIRSNPSNREIRALSARLDAGEPSAWRMLFDTRLTYHQRSAGRCRSEAECLAFGDCLHRRCAQQPHTDRCAGCGEVLPNGIGLVVERGAVRVHFDVGARLRVPHCLRPALARQCPGRIVCHWVAAATWVHASVNHPLRPPHEVITP